MEKYPIEKNIPIPITQIKREIKDNKFPFKNMDIGDSFLFPLTETDGNMNLLMKKFRAAVNTYRLKNPEFSAKTRREESGLRCWRVTRKKKKFRFKKSKSSTQF